MSDSHIKRRLLLLSAIAKQGTQTRGRKGFSSFHISSELQCKCVQIACFADYHFYSVYLYDTDGGGLPTYARALIAIVVILAVVGIVALVIYKLKKKQNPSGSNVLCSLLLPYFKILT
jgi:hypothetical protein